MKVLDLHCHAGHVFEGWFASEDDFQSQNQRGLVQCPFCGDSGISKRLSAPRLNLGAKPPAPQAPAKPAMTTPTGSQDSVALPPALQAAWLELARKIAANTEDVGNRFADEARRMHHGETEERAIRGQATPDEAAQLLDEGIAVLPLPLPVAAKETLH
ncbi:hypothetical protein PMI14_00560 [Acidovorax sp. CF316]|uniref:DUF1178 family protein n=1 Tax=Acidovorax sp. CF316 TaxID=1144317 RepID=UPI00026BC637|nr:DUF1178 family protein [Acidovorax sp. CF316]EJE54585.1 hypothetical protein PMI14_00560 [Acidovorax sp. CF316]